MISLEISHNIHLTKNQRYSINNGETVTTIGVALPVWLNNGAKMNIPEEVFCIYDLSSEDFNTIEENHLGYRLKLPDDNECFNIDENLWKLLNIQEQKKISLEKKMIPKNPQSLLDECDGGVKSLNYLINEKRLTNNNRLIRVNHIIEISDIDELIKSLV